ncbi:hypothetical protein GW17_00044620 [Ensete ventricosum]|nr:hypothetical protein GW17_00044620 [Ensete ventricosum]
MRWLPLPVDSHLAKGRPTLQPVPPPLLAVGLVAGGAPLWAPYNRSHLRMPRRKRVCPQAVATPAAGYCLREWRQPPFRAVARASDVGLPCGLALAAVDRPLVGGLGRGWPALHGGWSWLATPPPPYLHYENVARTRRSYNLVFPDPDGDDKGGQASSSLAVSTRWISVAKLLQYDLTTLAQREEGE